MIESYRTKMSTSAIKISSKMKAITTPSFSNLACILAWAGAMARIAADPAVFVGVLKAGAAPDGLTTTGLLRLLPFGAGGFAGDCGAVAFFPAAAGLDGVGG
jgi:hypothetical protein